MSPLESHRRRGIRLVWAACLGWCLIGCRWATGPATHPVSGTVTLDGKPLATGDVIFYPESENMPAVMGKLEEGRYSFRAVAGRHRVSIQAVGDKPRIVSPVDPPVYTRLVPTRYNQSTTLTADVTPAGPNRFDFDLTSDKPAAK
ncbi:MAG: hypothetical protein ACKOEM_01535 [Planctomycetia bacterium]